MAAGGSASAAAARTSSTRCVNVPLHALGGALESRPPTLIHQIEQAFHSLVNDDDSILIESPVYSYVSLPVARKMTARAR